MMELTFAPSMSGSTKVPRPTFVMSPWAARRTLPVQMGQDSLRQVECLDFLLLDHLAQFWNSGKVSADEPLHQSLMGQVIVAGVLAVSYATGVNQRQITRMALA